MRRLGVAGIVPIVTSGLGAAPRAATKMWSQEYWAEKGSVRLYMFRKRVEAPRPGAPARPVLFLVHGSSTSSRSTFDLEAPGIGEYSLMNVFAGYGYDVWTMDCENYGRSSRTEGNADVATGVADLEAGSTVVIRETGQRRYHFFGESSGALRAGVLAMKRPELIDRLVLGAFTYTGKGSPTLAERAKQLEFYKANARRPRDRAMIRTIFTRDKVGTGDPAVAEALADAELKFGESSPTGTYLDMTSKLPLVDPRKVLSPVLIVRGVYDGIATEEDLADFFRELPNGDRQMVIVPGAAHNLALALNREYFWRAMRSFLEMPPRRDRVEATASGS